MTEKIKRNIAYKLRIGDVLAGKIIMNGERFSFLELGNKRVVRVNIIGNIIDRYDNEGENKKYSFLTIDDGSGQIRIKMFGEDIEKAKEKNQGKTVLIIGLLRVFNNEVYIGPEIIKEKDPKYLLVRKMEVEEEDNKNAPQYPREERVAAKDKILGMIKDSEKDGGIDTEEIVLNLKEISANMINQEIQRFIEEGIIFEPRPGKVRYLG